MCRVDAARVFGPGILLGWGGSLFAGEAILTMAVSLTLTSFDIVLRVERRKSNTSTRWLTRRASEAADNLGNLKSRLGGKQRSSR